MYRVGVLALLVFGCGKSEPSVKAKQEPKVVAATVAPAVGTAVTPGSLKQAPVETVIGVAIPAGGNVVAAEQLARERGAAAKLEVMRTTIAAFGYDSDHLPISHDTLSDEQMQSVLGASAFIAIRGTGADGLAVLRAVATDASAVADARAGWVIDEGVSGVYSAEEFRKHVPGDVPDVRTLIVVHAVSVENDLDFLDTMGLRRLGLPELYVPAAAHAQLRRYMSLINAVAQTLLDGGDVTPAGQLEVDISKLHADWDLAEIRERKGTGKTTVGLRWSKGSGDHGEPGELSLEIVPPGGATTEAAEAMFDQLFGATPDKVTYLKEDDPELLAAGKRARSELAAMRGAVAKGIPFGETLSVKAKFTNDEGAVEWMWVDVVKFAGNVVDGTLANDPEIVKTVKAGQRVKVKLADIADYIHAKADGTTTGGYSVEVFRKRGLLD